ncbi:MAG: hypothetical protein V4672_13285 [Verrucomicrobiota bacterium]
MNWVDDMLTKALKTCPKGGSEPYVWYPSDGRGLALQTMKEFLEDTCARERPAVERMFSEWAKTGRWPRSSKHSGWFVRQILNEASSAGAVLSNQMTETCGQEGASHTAAVLQACLTAWYKQCLPQWIEGSAQQEYKTQGLVRWDHHNY